MNCYQWPVGRLLFLVAISQLAWADGLEGLVQKKWNHGSSDCAANTDPAIEVFQYDPATYVLRQNKCLNFEAPFLYLLCGDEKCLLLDTGATESEVDFPLYETVQDILNRRHDQETTAIDLMVVHSHNHSDHHQADSQFEGKPNVTVVAPTFAAMIAYLDLDHWPEGQADIELAGRTLIVIPSPGHQEEAIALYDPQTKWLLTGDTIYPGYIYVKDWADYKNSINRLASFAESHEIKAILGAHIEMTDRPGEYYSIGTTFQPDERSLVIDPEILATLRTEINLSDDARLLSFDNFIVAPMNIVQITISNISRWVIRLLSD